MELRILLGGIMMFDINALPSTIAEPLSIARLTLEEVTLTYTENKDEEKLYKELSHRLIELERSLEVNKEELQLISELANSFQTSIDEKEEILLRIDWLNRLYRVKEEVTEIYTNEKAKQLRRLLSPVQTCPLKKQLMEQIDILEKSLPEEKIPVTQEQQLMERAIEEIGADFINLGKAGRDFVISEVLEQFGDNATMENVKTSTLALEQRVKDLLTVNDPTKLLNQLENLPLKLFSEFKNDRKEAIVNRLMQHKKWNGLAALDRIIVQLNRAITAEQKKKEEMENTILTADGKAALVLDIKNINEDRILTI